MPGKNGHEVINEIIRKGQSKKEKIILLSSALESEDLPKHPSVTTVSVKKPVKNKTLHEMIAN